MKILCNLCGKIVSTEIPDNTLIRAWIECPECCALGEDERAILFKKLGNPNLEGIRYDTRR